ncbi:hypothetical protein [Nocardia sp. NBC_00511]|uniref:hypothetical protein n=1 Tax=Nocardia sp. NBC_00511 TaxID=2903591 RepID=UPI0030DF7850
MAAGGRVADLIRTRRLYTGEPHSDLKGRTVFDNAVPIPAAHTSDQALLESKVFRIFGDYGEWLAHPVGIARVRLGVDGGLTAWIDSHAELHPIRRELGDRKPGKIFHFSQTLVPMLLPHAHPGDELTGIPRLRVTSVRGADLTVSLIGTNTQVTLRGAPGTRWKNDIEQFRIENATTGLVPIWTAPELTSEEREFEEEFVGVTASTRDLSWIGSGLFRRVAVLQTSSNAYRTRYWSNPDHRTGGEWIFELCTRRDVPVDHNGLLARLLDPVWGLPVRVDHQLCMCEVDALWDRECNYDLVHTGGQRGVLKLRFAHLLRYYDGHDRRDFAALGSDEAWLDRVLPEPPGNDVFDNDELRARRRRYFQVALQAD